MFLVISSRKKSWKMEYVHQSSWFPCLVLQQYVSRGHFQCSLGSLAIPGGLWWSSFLFCFVGQMFSVFFFLRRMACDVVVRCTCTPTGWARQSFELSGVVSYNCHNWFKAIANECYQTAAVRVRCPHAKFEGVTMSTRAVKRTERKRGNSRTEHLLPTNNARWPFAHWLLMRALFVAFFFLSVVARSTRKSRSRCGRPWTTRSTCGSSVPSSSSGIVHYTSTSVHVIEKFNNVILCNRQKPKV